MSLTLTHARRLATRTAGRMNVLKSFKTFLSIRRERAALMKLDAQGLADIGKTRAQAQAEAKLPAWDAPARWTR